MEKIKVLAVMDHLGGGGAEYQFLELAKRLDRERFDLKVFLSEGGGQRLKDALLSGLDIDYVSPEVRRNTPKALLGLFGLMRRKRPDVVMAWLSYSATLSALAAGALGIKKLVFSERSSLEHLFNREVRFGGIKKFVLKQAFKRASVVVTNSKAVAREFMEFGYSEKDKTRVIPNGIDLERFSGFPPKDVLRERLGLSGGKIYGIYAGKLEYRKGITFLMDALREIDVPGAEFLALGSGSCEDEVRKCKNLTFLGYRENAVEYIKASDFLILPSIYEGLPNVVLEAMAVGTPVIAAGVSGVPEIVDDGKTGLIVPPGESAPLREAIERLLRDEDLRAALASGALSKAGEFEMKKMVASYEGLLREIASG